MISAENIREAMNDAAEKGEPFLFCIDYEMTQGFFIKDPLNERQILWRVGGVTNALSTPPYSGGFFRKHPIPYAEYLQKFEKVQSELRQGNSFLANLTVKTPIETDFSFEEIFHRANSTYALYVPDLFVCFSPETFVTIEGGKIGSNPMKGTISGAVENAEQTILADYKESAEHFTIVDFIRNDLSRVATGVHVERLRYIDRLSTSDGEILQVSSLISGKTTHNRLGDIVFAMLPAGSVSGAPKQSTLRILAAAEGAERGFYCGVFGYFDGTKLDSAVLIRFIEQKEGKRYFRSGGGITVNSNALDEYKEVIEKIYLPFTETYIETIQVKDGVFINTDEHRSRMLRTIGKEHALPTEVPPTYRHGTVKCRVLYDKITIREVTFTPYTLPSIKSLQIVECTEIDYHNKYADRSELNALMKQKGTCDDILITQNGAFTDTSFCNVVFENEEGLFTPDTPLLCGTKRAFLLKKGVLRERRITPSDLPLYNKIHLINAMIDLEDKVTISSLQIINDPFLR